MWLGKLVTELHYIRCIKSIPNRLQELIFSSDDTYLFIIYQQRCLDVCLYDLREEVGYKFAQSIEKYEHSHNKRYFYLQAFEDDWGRTSKLVVDVEMGTNRELP